MGEKLEENLRHDTIGIEWHARDEELVATALRFYMHEINNAVNEYSSNQRQCGIGIEIEKKYGENYLFGMTISSKKKTFLNTTKIILTGYVFDARPGENIGKKILTFKEGYYHKEPFIRWAVNNLIK